MQFFFVDIISYQVPSCLVMKKCYQICEKRQKQKLSENILKFEKMERFVNYILTNCPSSFLKSSF